MKTVCPACHGDNTCGHCSGTGSRYPERSLAPCCPVCKGSGTHRCEGCEGTGTVPACLFCERPCDDPRGFHADCEQAELADAQATEDAAADADFDAVEADHAAATTEGRLEREAEATEAEILAALDFGKTAEQHLDPW